MSFFTKGDFLCLLPALSMFSSCRTKGELRASLQTGLSVKGMGLFISLVIGSFVRKGPMRNF